VILLLLNVIEYNNDCMSLLFIVLPNVDSLNSC